MNPTVLLPLALASLLIVVAWIQSRKSKELRDRLETMAREMGWSDLKWSSFFTMGIQGMWNGYSGRIRRIPRQKSIPERIAASVRLQAPARIVITRRQHGLYAGRPLSCFGPPLVDLPLYSQFWIRADEITLADRLMHSSAAALIDRILQSRLDFLRMNRDELIVQRVSSNDPDEVARLAREELELLRGVIDALALRP